MFFHHEAEGINEWLDGWHLEAVVIAPLCMLILALIALGADPDAVSAAFAAVVVFSPVWLPIVLFVMFWKRWIHFVRFRFWFSQPHVLLHVELPPTIEKSPAAIELVLTSLWNAGGETTFIARFWRGQFRGVSTLEIASNGGRIGYYVHLRESWKNTFESRLYGQFPGAQVKQVKDYIAEANYTPATHDLWGTEYQKGKADAVPIRTYVDWKLDKDTDKPEVQVDPLTHILEFMSSIRPGEYVWLQIVMRARKKDEWYGIYRKKDTYRDGGKEAIQKIFAEAVDRTKQQVTDEDAQKALPARGVQLLSQPERDRVEAIERNFDKLVFDCGVRTLYIAEKDKFNGVNIGNVVNLFAPFRHQEYNSLSVTRGHSIFDYPWQDWGTIRRDMVRRRLYFWQKNRAYFFVPYDQSAVMMTVEELASLWHFPSAEVKTPGLVRVPAKVSEAPVNLPTGQGRAAVLPVAPPNLPR